MACNSFLQIWRGALLLADFLLDTISSSLKFHNINAIELGAGTGKVAKVHSILWISLINTSERF